MPSPMRRTRCTTSIRTEEDRWLYGPPVTATIEEIRYAERLRREIRAQFQRRAEPRFAPWTIGVE